MLLGIPRSHGETFIPQNTASLKHNEAETEVLSMATEGPLSVPSLRAQRRWGAETSWEWKHKHTSDSCRDRRRPLWIDASVRTKSMYCPEARWWGSVHIDESNGHLSLEERAGTGILVWKLKKSYSLIPDQEESLKASSEAGALFCSHGEPRPFTLDTSQQRQRLTSSFRRAQLLIQKSLPHGSQQRRNRTVKWSCFNICSPARKRGQSGSGKKQWGWAVEGLSDCVVISCCAVHSVFRVIEEPEDQETRSSVVFTLILVWLSGKSGDFLDA